MSTPDCPNEAESVVNHPERRRIVLQLMLVGVYRRDGSYLGVPVGTTVIEPCDGLVVYAEDAVVVELKSRRAGPDGDAAHAAAVERYRSRRADVSDG